MRFLVEESQRLSRSRLWRLQRRFFEQAGPTAWSRAIVPHWITSNPFIAAAYARVVFAYLEDAADSLDGREPVYALELGAGSGRFAFQFLQRFAELSERAGTQAPRFTYVMTDLAEANVAAWRAHPSLRSFVERGLVDFARFDGERDDELRLEHSGRVLAPGALANPLVAIANYYFDGVPQDMFLVDSGELREALVSLYSPQEEPDPDDVELFARVELEYQPGAPVLDYYYGEPELDRILDGYRRALAGSAVSFPIAGLESCRRLERLAGGRLLLVAADKGAIHEAALDGQAPPSITPHGSFSLGVNFHALGAWFRARGGAVLAPREHAGAIVTAAFLLGAGEHARTRAAFADALDGFNPDAWYALKKSVEPHYESLGVAGLLALFALSGDDPRVVGQCLPHLNQLAPRTTAVERAQLAAALDRAWQRYFHLGEELDFPFAAGLLLLHLERYPHAIEFFFRSLDLYGPDANTLYNLGLAHFRLRAFDDAANFCERALAVDGAHKQALALRDDAEKQRALTAARR